MNEIGICDYSDYDYKTDFWENANRKYEHQLELKIVAKLLKNYVTTFNSVLDAGCGFGRMSPSYQGLFTKCHMVDFAPNLLKQADDQLKPKEKFKYYKQSLYELNIDQDVNAIVSIRTLHHLNDVKTLFKRYHEALNNNGILILDIPNYYHLKNTLIKSNRKKEDMIELSKNFYNYNPQFIVEKLKKTGFNILSYRQLGLFRVNLLKKYLPASLLVNTELFLNNFIKYTHIAPSVYVIAKKC